MSDKKQKKVKRWMRDRLNNLYRQGYGKPKIKGIHNETPYIHSESTFKAYMKACDRFGRWLQEEKHVTDVNAAWSLVPEYLQSLVNRNLSAWTISQAMNAIAKAWGVSTTEIDFVAPKRERAAVKRSRYAAVRDAHFSEESHKELINLCLCCGPRLRELQNLRGTDLYQCNGIWYVHIANGKGGKKRDVQVIGTPDQIKLLQKTFKNADIGKVFTSVPSAFDCHHYRALYAQRAYLSKARKDIPAEDRYICRKDKKGVIYDRPAMLFASRQLGHNRIDVIANSYLYTL